MLLTIHMAGQMKTGAAVGIVFFIKLFSMNMIILGMRSRRLVTTASNIMLDMLVAGCTGKVFTNRVHMHIKFTLGHRQ